MKKVLTGFAACLILASCLVQKPDSHIEEKEVYRIISTLASDDMRGRATFTPGADMAAKFIENEFRKIGLKSLNGDNDFRQDFTVSRLKPSAVTGRIDGKDINSENIFAVTDQTDFTLKNGSGVEVLKLTAQDQFIQKYREFSGLKKPTLILVDQQHATIFKRLKDNSARGRVVMKKSDTPGVIFVLGSTEASEFSFQTGNTIAEQSLFNVVGMIPGKSKEKEIVLFSSHYDHIGVGKAVNQDSIFNGADDNASGTTAVIQLAQYYKNLKDNERTLIFVAFTAEEIGGYGARHFSSNMNPDDVVAMFNIEMIGKDSKFGKNAAFITGYERSDFGEILQKNLEGTAFIFHADPYPTQNLFYRSDNATLAALGVPAHTISTDQIDTDKFYHTVDDEIETLDMGNIVATIKAIALSARGIISGKDTPKRIPKQVN